MVAPARDLSDYACPAPALRKLRSGAQTRGQSTNSWRHRGVRSDCRGGVGSDTYYDNPHALFGRCLRAVRLSRPQRQLVIPRRKLGRDHDELSGLIRDRLVPSVAVEQ